MSAITVIFNLDGRPVERRVMDEVLDRLEHRGRDARGVWVDGDIGLGHRMMWITPESLKERLPIKDSESSLVLTCDARIDNRDELIPQLSISTLPVNEITDADIILAAYKKWGNECISKFIGDFVFAIWDPKEQRLVCARDSMGVRHFYYLYRPGEIFAIASEAKALFCHPDIPKDLNETNIGDILILNYQDKEATPFKNIKRLPANHALEVSRKGLRTWQYWHPKPRAQKRFFGPSDKDYEEQFRKIFTEAVTCRLRSIYPVGSMLSGGLDSSSISCVASRYLAELNREPLETFSAIFPAISEIDPRIDERHFMNSVIREINCNPNFVEADTCSPLMDMEKLHWHADHPIGAPNVFMDWELFKAANKREVRVLLSGFDGDSTVSYGYEAFHQLARQGRWLQLARDAMALNKHIPCRHHEFKRLVWKLGLRKVIPDVLFRFWRVVNGRPARLEKTFILPSALNYNFQSMNTEFAEKEDLKNRYFSLIEKNQPEDAGDVEDNWNALCNGLFAFVLETLEKAGAAFSLTPAYPFFDRRLIEFCINVPARQRVRNGWTRSLFRRAMKGIIPAEIQWRPDKANIGLSFKVNLLKYGLSDTEETILDSPKVLEKYVNIETLKAAFDRYKNDPLKYEGEPMFILSTVYLSNWLRRSFGRGT